MKKICPVAASQTGAANSTLKSGTHIYANPDRTLLPGFDGSGAPRKSIRIARISAKMMRSGISILALRSIPLTTPFEIMMKLIPTVIARNTIAHTK